MRFRATVYLLVLVFLLALAITTVVDAGTIAGRVLDPNWYARVNTYEPYGVGQYEYAVNANGENISTVGGYDDTDIFGNFSTQDLPTGKYTVASWDVWWRSAYVFNVNVSGAYQYKAQPRLRANMWGYPAFWDDGYHQEFGQMFTASGSSVAMLYFRVASTGDGEVTFHSGGPGGPKIGPKKTFHSNGGPGDIRLVYNGGEVATTPGSNYYVSIKFTTGGGGAILMMDPIPDNIDPMPGGCVYFDGQAEPGRDLGIVICSDDDGVVTNMYTRSGGSNFNYVTSAGQTFKARGTSLISAAAWVPTPSAAVVFKVYDQPGGTQIGTTKKNYPARWGDPEVIVTWQPGEVPLTPGNTYYLEITRDGGGMFTAYANQWQQYPNGDAYAGYSGQPATIQPNWDLAGTIMEEEYSGSATKPEIKFGADPVFPEANRTPTSITVMWNTSVACDSLVEYAADFAPYTDSKYNATAVTAHSMTLTGLKPNTLYHIRVTSKRAGYRDAVSRDLVVCTKNDSTNLLTNGDFEQGTGATPRRSITGWTNYGSVDIGASDGAWFWSLPAHAGTWFVQGAVNGSGSNGGIYQRVAVTPGMKYNLSAWFTTWMRENNNWKYDVWHQNGRLIYMNLGVDPYGGTNPDAVGIQWTPRVYSHLRYNPVALSFVPASNYVTIFIRMQGKGGEWHLYGVDDCILTRESTETNLANIKMDVPNDTSVSFSDGIVTAIPSQAGAYYVELPNRSTGIRVESNDTVNEGSVVSVHGGLVTLASGERALTNASISATAAGTVPGALLMNCNNVGGLAYGQIPAVPGTEGPHNTGLLIKIAGNVTQKAADNSYVFVNDGSMPGDGIKVDTGSISAAKVPNVGSVVGIVGISTLYNDGSTTMPLVKARRDADVSEKLN